MKRRNSFTDPESKMVPASAEGATTALALNDDCLLEVFKYLNVVDLSAIADVCHRFRQNARACFAYSTKKSFHLRSDDDNSTLNQILLKTSRVLRNFGEFVVEFSHGAVSHFNRRRIVEDENCKYCPATIELLLRYSSEALTELELVHFDITESNTLMIGPLIKRLHKFSFRRARMDCFFRDMWPQWSEELRELQFDSVSGNNNLLHQPFQNLKRLVWRNKYFMNHTGMTHILKHNPQLREITFHFLHSTSYAFELDMLFQSIVANVPEIESISLRSQNGDECPIPENGRNIEYTYLGRLSKLTKLTLQVGCNRSEFVLAELCAISAANIPLRHLCLYDVDFKDNYHKFVDAMSKFKQLETLKLLVCLESGSDYPVSTLCKICKHCPELSKLILLGDIHPTVENMLQIIRNSDKLRSLVVRSRSGRESMRENLWFTTDTYKRLLKIVESRREKAHLKIELDGNYCVLVPDDLVTAHRESLSIVCPGSRFGDFGLTT